MLRHGRRTDERGAALVEFALILPVLMLFLFGIVEFGRAYSARIQLTSAVREGARTAALGLTDVDGVKTATRDAAPGLDPSAITVLYTPAPGSSCTGASTTTTASSIPPTTISTATVQATYDFTYDIPLFRTGTWTLSATGVMRCGG